MYRHSIFGWLFRGVSLFPPKKAEEVTMFFINVDLVEHALYVTGECHRFLSETTQDTNQGVRQIGALQKMAIKGMFLELC